MSDIIDRTTVKSLLLGLLAGAETPLEDVTAWEARLRPLVPDPLLGRFMDQLRVEWPDITPPNALCASITAQAREHVSGWHSGWPHLWAHIQRVTGTALALAGRSAGRSGAGLSGGHLPRCRQAG